MTHKRHVSKQKQHAGVSIERRASIEHEQKLEQQIFLQFEAQKFSADCSKKNRQDVDVLLFSVPNAANRMDAVFQYNR
jgi:hypothetical protein